ncbi:MRG-domain-containing protein [Xylariomycetidae sp. FL0641]|nr:MRG-domain-containing protein [Xylariomycetidae sp. FL0641]
MDLDSDSGDMDIDVLNAPKEAVAPARRYRTVISDSESTDMDLDSDSSDMDAGFAGDDAPASESEDVKNLQKAGAASGATDAPPNRKSRRLADMARDKHSEGNSKTTKNQESNGAGKPRIHFKIKRSLNVVGSTKVNDASEAADARGLSVDGDSDATTIHDMQIDNVTKEPADTNKYKHKHKHKRGGAESMEIDNVTNDHKHKRSSADTVKTGDSGLKEPKKSKPAGKAKKTGKTKGVVKPNKPKVQPKKQASGDLMNNVAADPQSSLGRLQAFAKKERDWIRWSGRTRDFLVDLPQANLQYVDAKGQPTALAQGPNDRRFPVPPARRRSDKLILAGVKSDSPYRPSADSRKLIKAETPADSRQLIKAETPADSRQLIKAETPANSRQLIKPETPYQPFQQLMKARTPYRLFPDPRQLIKAETKTSALQKAKAIDTNDVIKQEETFHTRPSVKIIIPDVLKGFLVDDWENVTKNMQLVPLPHPKPVTKILSDYAAYETPKRSAGSSHVDILTETLAGVKEYFDKALGRILLYRYERGQYAELYKQMNAAEGELAGKSASDVYGVEHLMRLMVSLPELLAQTNMDQQSVNRLREELSKFCAWISKNATEYFVSSYESPSADYTEKMRS